MLEKAAIKVPAAAVLLYRSDAESDKNFLNELAAALEPYRMDDYAEAARRLDVLAKKYPKYAEPHYYLGVSRLFSGENEAALGALNAARPLADVGRGELPVVVGEIDASQKARALLLLGDVQKQLYDPKSVVGEVALPVIDLPVAALPHPFGLARSGQDPLIS